MPAYGREPTPIDDWETAAEAAADEEGDGGEENDLAGRRSQTMSAVTPPILPAPGAARASKGRNAYLERYTLGSTFGSGGGGGSGGGATEDLARLYVPSGSTFAMGGMNAALAHAAYAAESQPSVKIMRRQDNDEAARRRANGSGGETMDSNGQLSLEARERAYREARERIFGPAESGNEDRSRTGKKAIPIKSAKDGSILNVENLIPSQGSSRSGSDSEPRAEPGHRRNNRAPKEKKSQIETSAREGSRSPLPLGKKKAKSKAAVSSEVEALAGEEAPVPLAKDASAFLKDPRTVKDFVPRASPNPTRTISPSVRSRAENLGTAIRPPRGPGAGRGFESRQRLYEM